MLAPWMGGFYERLIGLVKRALKKSIGKKCLTLVQLQTITAEIQAVINSRPLVYISEDINSGHILTPSDFFSLNPKQGTPVLEDCGHDTKYVHGKISTAEKIITIWTKGQKYLNQFWQIWRDDFLMNLRERSQMNLKQAHIESDVTPRVGDVVLVKENLPRGMWKLGKIQQLIQSTDQKIRSARVMVANGNLINRPLNLLFPTECPRNDITKDTEMKDSAQSSDTDERVLAKT